MENESYKLLNYIYDLQTDFTHMRKNFTSSYLPKLRVKWFWPVQVINTSFIVIFGTIVFTIMLMKCCKSGKKNSLKTEIKDKTLSIDIVTVEEQELV